MTILKSIRLPVEYDNYWWTISPITGSLIRHLHKPSPSQFDPIPKELENALSICNNPFDCDWNPTSVKSSLSIDNRNKLEKMNFRLHLISNRRFYLSIMYASIKKPLFATSREAFSEIATLPEQIKARSDHCLQRSLLVAKTSASFKKYGVLLIGASIASAEMHSWIIEAGTQPDHEDRNWINFQPLLALRYE